ncbi:unnamed protein product [Rodentolepis nana]|uniref:Ovule protein n=1 Tax=Rodentolepis nana TaxID=102285 RepID=A0A0R3T9B6_RODNA|nr:unnamed protein product [Rodentolepis nana]
MCWKKVLDIVGLKEPGQPPVNHSFHKLSQVFTPKNIVSLKEPAPSGGMGVEVSQYYSYVFVGFSVLGSFCPLTSLKHSTGGSEDIVIRPDEGDFSYSLFSS